MTKDEALKLALEVLEEGVQGTRPLGVATLEAIATIKEALAQPEPVKIAHKHEWFRTGEMKVGQMRCISCGTWGQEEIPQRTWVGLTDEEAFQICVDCGCLSADWLTLLNAIEAKLRSKNNV